MADVLINQISNGNKEETDLESLQTQIIQLTNRINDLESFKNNLRLLNNNSDDAISFVFNIGDGLNENNTTPGTGIFTFVKNELLHFAYFGLYIETMSWGTSTLQDLPLVPKSSADQIKCDQIKQIIRNKLGTNKIISIPLSHSVSPNAIREINYALQLRINTTVDAQNFLYTVVQYGAGNINTGALSRLISQFYPIQWG